MATAVIPETHTATPVHFNTVRINDLDIFYREAGPQGAPVILLLPRHVAENPERGRLGSR